MKPTTIPMTNAIRALNADDALNYILEFLRRAFR